MSKGAFLPFCCRLLLVFWCVQFTSGCADMAEYFGVRPMVGPTWMQDMLKSGPPNAPPIYSQGWSDGCESATAVTANAFQRRFYRFKLDPDLYMNAQYHAGWKAALTYCHRYILQYLRRYII